MNEREKELRDVVETKYDLDMRLRDIQNEVKSFDFDVVKKLVSMDMNDFLTINWAALKRNFK